MPIITRTSIVAMVGAFSAGVVLVLGVVASPGTAWATPLSTPHATKYPFAGYITSPMAVTSSAATVTVPTVACGKKLSAITAAATVYDSTGSEFSSAEVYIGCSSKKERLAAYAEIDNAFTVPTVTINPGDTVELLVTCGSLGISVSIDDETTNSIGTAASTKAESCTQAEAGDDGVTKGHGSALVALPPFGTIDYTGVMVNGAAIGSFSPTATTYSEGKKNVITTGPLTAGGTAFTTTQGS
jgi:hypothetical protein